MSAYVSGPKKEGVRPNPSNPPPPKATPLCSRWWEGGGVSHAQSVMGGLKVIGGGELGVSHVQVDGTGLRAMFKLSKGGDYGV